MADASPPDPKPAPSTLQIFLVFTRIAMTSFGGGMTGWLMRELVDNRRWIDREEFLTGLAVAQALPGVNIANMAVWTGYRLRGLAGVAAGLAAMIIPPGITILILGAVFDDIERFTAARVAIMGAGAVAVAISGTLAVQAVRGVRIEIIPYLVMAASFAAIAIFHMSILLAILIFSTISIAIAWVRAEPQAEEGE